MGAPSTPEAILGTIANYGLKIPENNPVTELKNISKPRPWFTLLDPDEDTTNWNSRIGTEKDSTGCIGGNREDTMDRNGERIIKLFIVKLRI